jgi:hypothetical protein
MEDKMERKSQKETQTNSQGTLKVEKKPYASPQLTEYGNVEKLTRGGQGSGTDGGSDPTMMMVCL